MTFRQTALALALSLALMVCGSAAFADSHEGAAPEPKRVEHPSGLIVVIVEPGTGEPIEKGQTAVVHYTGWLDAGDWKKGEKFDSSLDRGKPFPVRNVGSGRVIKGWNDGIAPHGSLSGMRLGEKRQLLIPAKLGYGSRGAGAKIPPNARLIFDIEMLEIR
jgi:peptidylprolyl isomerase